MNNTGRIILAVLLLLPALTPVIFSQIEVFGSPARGSEEDLRLNVTVEFHGTSHFIIRSHVSIFEIDIGSTLFNNHDLRESYRMQPENTSETLGMEIEDRVLNITSLSFSGDSLELSDLVIDNSSLVGNHSDTDPIMVDLEILGTVNLERYMDPDMLERLNPDRVDLFVTGMLSAGFEYSRTITLRADPGQKVTYNFASEWDPLGDGAVHIHMRERGSTPPDGNITIELDSSNGEFVRHFTFILGADPVEGAVDERINGTIFLDWYTLGGLNITGTVLLGPLDPVRTDIVDSIPPSMTIPRSISPGFIRFARDEGMITDDDIHSMEERIAAEFESSLSDALGKEDVNLSALMEKDPIDPPMDGMDIWNIVSNPAPIPVSISTAATIKLDILDDHDPDEVMGLLNGGLRIRRQSDPITDERITPWITLPRFLMFTGEKPESIEDNRTTYPFSGAFKTITSVLAPSYGKDEIDLQGNMDLSMVRSQYIADMVIDIRLNSTLSVHHIKFDPGDYDVNTNMDYELDYLTSDLMRLLDRMGIINRSDVEKRITDRVMDLVDGLIDHDDRVVSVSLNSFSMIFDNDVEHMDGNDPILIDVSVSGRMTPLEGANENDDGGGIRDGFIPFHHDPIIPVRTVIRTLDTSSMKGWNTSLRIRFPSGSGIRAWLGDGENDRYRELEVVNDGGYPTLVIDPGDSMGDHITLEFTVGPYFAFDNVTACFCSTWTVFGLLLLLIAVLIVRGMIRRKKRSGSGKADDDEEGNIEKVEGNVPEPSNGGQGTLQW